MTTDTAVYADTFAFAWILDPAEILVPVPDDARALVAEYMSASIEVIHRDAVAGLAGAR